MRFKALLLAAGKGTRLWPLTEVRAKAAVPYRGVPLVRRLAEQFLAAGVSDVAVNLHHLPHTVRTALRGIPVTYSYEEGLLGTSGALHPLRVFLEGSWFWTVNAKIATTPLPPFGVTTEDLAIITAVLVRAPGGAPYTRVDTAGSPPRIAGFREAASHDGTGFLFTGVQLVSPLIWEFLPGPGFSHFPSDVYPRIEAAGQSVAAWVSAGVWREFSTVSRYLQHHLDEGCSPEWWGSDARISPTANVSDSVIWDGVVVEEGAAVHRCVLTDGVRIRSGRSVDRAAVVRLDRTGRDPRGEVLDDNLVVPIRV